MERQSTTSKKVSSWSWQDIQRLYYIYGRQLEEYRDLADRFELQLPLAKEEAMRFKPGDVITVADAGRSAFVGAFIRDVNRINNHLRLLDAEIARRNSLIGVIG